jgi:hypothetical protein
MVLLILLFLILLIVAAVVAWYTVQTNDIQQKVSGRVSSLDTTNTLLHHETKNAHTVIANNMDTLGMGINSTNDELRYIRSLNGSIASDYETASNNIKDLLQNLEEINLTKADRQAIADQITSQKKYYERIDNYKHTMSNFSNRMKLALNAAQEVETRLTLGDAMTNSLDISLNNVHADIGATANVYKDLDTYYQTWSNEFSQVPFDNFDKLTTLAGKDQWDPLDTRVKPFVDKINTMMAFKQDIDSDNSILTQINTAVQTLSNVVRDNSGVLARGPAVNALKDKLGNVNANDLKKTVDSAQSAFTGYGSIFKNAENDITSIRSSFESWFPTLKSQVPKMQSVQAKLATATSAFGRTNALFDTRSKDTNGLNQVTRLKSDIAAYTANMKVSNNTLENTDGHTIKSQKLYAKGKLCFADTCIDESTARRLKQGRDKTQTADNCADTGEIFAYLENHDGKKLLLRTALALRLENGITYQFKDDFFKNFQGWGCSGGKNNVVAVYIPPNKKMRIFTVPNADYYSGQRKDLEGGTTGLYQPLEGEFSEFYKRVCSVEYGDSLTSPINCSAGGWSGEQCPTQCGYGGGQITRNRTITQGKYGGQQCTDMSASQNVSCPATAACYQPKPMCQWNTVTTASTDCPPCIEGGSGYRQIPSFSVRSVRADPNADCDESNKPNEYRSTCLGHVSYCAPTSQPQPPPVVAKNKCEYIPTVSQCQGGECSIGSKVAKNGKRTTTYSLKNPDCDSTGVSIPTTIVEDGEPKCYCPNDTYNYANTFLCQPKNWSAPCGPGEGNLFEIFRYNKAADAYKPYESEGPCPPDGTLVYTGMTCDSCK